MSLYLVRVSPGRYLARGSVVRKSNATNYSSPAAARTAAQGYVTKHPGSFTAVVPVKRKKPRGIFDHPVFTL